MVLACGLGVHLVYIFGTCGRRDRRAIEALEWIPAIDWRRRGSVIRCFVMRICDGEAAESLSVLAEGIDEGMKVLERSRPG